MSDQVGREPQYEVFADEFARHAEHGFANGHYDRPACLSLLGDVAYPGGESWRQAVERVGLFLNDLPLRWDGQRVLVIGHVATRWALDHFLGGVPLEDLMAEDFAWQEGWEYRLTSFPCTQNPPG